MPSEHARLGPSSAYRWMRCAGSVLATEEAKARGDIGDNSNEWADEGSAAHTIAFMHANRASNGEELELAEAGWSYGDRYADDMPEMIRHAEDWALLLDEAVQEDADSFLLLEKRIHTGIKHVWGTPDALIVAPNYVHVLDYKYGQGIKVDAEGNYQMMLYAAGAMGLARMLGFDVQSVKMTIYQPRVRGGPSRSDASMSAAELSAWVKYEAKPAAELALTPGAGFSPGPVACSMCPLSGRCAAQTAYLVQRDFGVGAGVLSEDELIEALELLPLMRAWIEQVQKYALGQAGQGLLPGYKVVRSAGRRVIPERDVPRAVEILTAAGFGLDQVTRPLSLETLGTLEQRVGRARLSELLADVLVKTEGGPVLALESDSRPPISEERSAQQDFTPLGEEEYE